MIELSDNQRQVLAAVEQIEPAFSREIAAHMGLPRNVVYHQLGKLRKLGCLSFTGHGQSKCWSVMSGATQINMPRIGRVSSVWAYARDAE